MTKAFLGFLGVGLVFGLAPGCKSDPEVTGRQPRCGNGFLEEDEVCDSETQYCAQDCMSELGECGDGIVQSEFGEVCDIAPGAGGAGSAGGAGGADSSDISQGSVGCAECQAAPGFLCDAADNTCQQTGVPPSELANDHKEEICTYYVGIWGGPGNTFACTVDDETFYITAGEVEDCVEELAFRDDCTILEFESWTEGKSRCEITTGENPCVLPL